MADLPAVAVLIPVLRRPHRAAVVAKAFTDAATGPQHIVFVATDGDDAEIEACRATDASVLILPGPRQPGDWPRKINYAYQATHEPMMLLAGDDVHPRSGWHDEVANAYRQGYGVIGTQDLGNRYVLQGLHSTHPVVARWYANELGTVDGPGAVVSEVYHHNFCDNELVGTAKARGLWTFCNAAVIEHFHPNFGKAEMDSVYALGREGHEVDRWTHEMRSHLWMSLSPLPLTARTDGSS